MCLYSWLRIGIRVAAVWYFDWLLYALGCLVWYLLVWRFIRLVWCWGGALCVYCACVFVCFIVVFVSAPVLGVNSVVVYLARILL